MLVIGLVGLSLTIYQYSNGKYKRKWSNEKNPRNWTGVGYT